MLKRQSTQKDARVPHGIIRMRVLVAYSELILAAGIEGILAQENDLSVKGVSQSGSSAISKEVMGYQPDVIIFIERTVPDGLCELLDQMTLSPAPRIMVLDPDNNRIILYIRQEIEVTQSTDLADAIRWQPALPARGEEANA